MSSESRIWIMRGLLGFTVLVAGILWSSPPLAVSTLVMYQSATDPVRRALGAEIPEQLCSVGEVYRGAKQRLQWGERETACRTSATLATEADGFERWETSCGDWWIPANNFHQLPAIATQMSAGYYAFDNAQSTAVVEAGDIVVDCGAHVGTYARQALADGAKLVVAVEPSPLNLEALRRNLAEEIAAGKVIVAPVGVWDKEEMLPIYENENMTGGSSFVPGLMGEPSHVIRLTTIDGLAEEYDLPRIDVIKMDIKGATLKALEGARGTIERDQPLLTIATEEGDEFENPHTVTDAVAALSSTYDHSCGDTTVHRGRVRPNVLFYR